MTTTTTDLYALISRVTGDEKHEPSATSTLDVLWVLYDRVLRVDPSTVEYPGRDWFLLSKGHGPAAYYAVLAAKGFIPVDWLDDVGGADSRLGRHPDRTLVPGVEISSGSLGHGLGLAVGVTLGLRAQGLIAASPLAASGLADSGLAGMGRAAPGARVFVLLGDAELDEGSNHEAIAYAGATGLAGLTAIVVDNQSATHGWPGGIAARFATAGWTTSTVDGRDHGAIEAGLRAAGRAAPHAMVAVVERKR